MDTDFSREKKLILQIAPEHQAGIMQIDGLTAIRVPALIFIPKRDGTKICCPLNYFLDNSSLKGKWIYDDNKNKIPLEGIDSLEEVIITIKYGSYEREVNISSLIKTKLLEYFKLELSIDGAGFEGFDCHAFVCFLYNLKCVPEKPNFKFIKEIPNIGKIVALTINSSIPESIKYWALKIDDDLYLSKFGQHGMGTQSHISFMNLEGMCKLYKCNSILHAVPIENGNKWDGTFLRKD